MRESFPKIVTLCGSTRFKAEFERFNREETLAGHIVIAPGVFGHADGIELSDEVKADLDRLHFRKIDMADEIVFVAPDGYMGTSTRRELAYAEKLGKPTRVVNR
jgi:hypothetical protein